MQREVCARVCGELIDYRVNGEGGWTRYRDGAVAALPHLVASAALLALHARTVVHCGQASLHSNPTAGPSVHVPLFRWSPPGAAGSSTISPAPLDVLIYSSYTFPD